MPLKKPRKNLVIDVGAGSGEFTRLLRKRNQRDEVVGIDRNPESKADVKDFMGSFFAHSLKEPARVKSVWLNHVDIVSGDAFHEFKAMANSLKPGSLVVLTMRQDRIQAVKNALEAAGLKLKAEKPWNPKMIGSPDTKRFYSEGKKPVRIVAVK